MSGLCAMYGYVLLPTNDARLQPRPLGSIRSVYSVYFWTGRWRATPGKRIVGLVVATDGGFTLDAGKSVWRVVALFISGSILIGPLLAVTSERRQALHDLLAGTVVIKAKAAERVSFAAQAK